MVRIEKVGVVATEKKNSSSKSKETKPEAETPEIEEAVLVDEPVKDEPAKEDPEKGAADDNLDKKPDEAPADYDPSTEGVMVAPVPAKLEPERDQSVFWPLLLGGIIAAILGFLASELNLFGDDNQESAQLRSVLASQQERITALEEADPVSLEPMRNEVTTQLGSIDETLADIQERLTELENRPVVTGESTVDTTAYENQLNALQRSVEEQRSEIEGLLQNARSVEEATAEAAKVASAQAALTRIISAIDDGQGYAAPLDELQQSGATIPPDLAANAEGVTTLAALQDSFPEAAREALSEARSNAPDEGAQGFGGFLKRQLGARSVTPREGSDADAVLSRAEAALRRGDLDQTLAEIASLPDAAQSAIADWRARAEARQAAKTAAFDLSQSLTAN